MVVLLSVMLEVEERGKYTKAPNLFLLINGRYRNGRWGRRGAGARASARACGSTGAASARACGSTGAGEFRRGGAQTLKVQEIIVESSRNHR